VEQQLEHVGQDLGGLGAGELVEQQLEHVGQDLGGLGAGGQENRRLLVVS
jgi:hypothetical protein